jgi:hypothetical protein
MFLDGELLVPQAQDQDAKLSTWLPGQAKHLGADSHAKTSQVAEQAGLASGVASNDP